MTRREALRRHDLVELVKLGAVTPEYLQEVEAYDYYKAKAREWKPGAKAARYKDWKPG